MVLSRNAIRFGPVSRTDTSQWPCPIARAVDVLGDSWNLLILRQAYAGNRRFEQFQSSLGIGRAILARHLTQLVDEGLLDRVPYQVRPPRSEYRLTPKGRAAFPVIAALAAWGDEWMTSPDGRLLELHHTRCDHDMTAVTVCSSCREPLDVRDVRGRPGPGARAARRAEETAGPE